jgi:hypothetical protein
MNGNKGRVQAGDCIVPNLCGLALIALLSFVDVRTLGPEWLTDLEKGNPWSGETVPQPVSLADSDTYLNCMKAVIPNYTEVQRISSQLGHRDGGADVIDFFNTVLFVPLKRTNTCPSGVDQEGRACDDWHSSPAGIWPGFLWRLPLMILMGASLLPSLIHMVRRVHYSLRRRGSRPNKSGGDASD